MIRLFTQESITKKQKIVIYRYLFSIFILGIILSSLAIISLLSSHRVDPYVAIKEGNFKALKKLNLRELSILDAQGFSLLDYTYEEMDKTLETNTKETLPQLREWLIKKGIDSGVNAELLMQSQYFLYLIDLPVDNFIGLLTPQTESSLSQYADQQNQSLSFKGSPYRLTPSLYTSLKTEALKEAQTLLNKKASIKITGEFDKETETALLNQITVNNQPLSLYERLYLLKDQDKQHQLAQKEAEEKRQEEEEKELSTTYSTLSLEAKEELLAQIAALENSAISTKTLTLQTWLKIIGFYPHPIDGRMGPTTRSAIRRYEASLNQKETGIPDPKWEAPLEKTVRTEVQKRLKILGYYKEESNGVNNIATQHATAAFEKDQGLEPHGTLSPGFLLYFFNDRPLLTSPSPKEEMEEEVKEADAKRSPFDIFKTDQDELVDFEEHTDDEAQSLLPEESAEEIEEKGEVEDKGEDEGEEEDVPLDEADEELIINRFDLTLDEIKEAILNAHSNTLLSRQVWLYMLGKYHDQFDGAIGPKTREAITDYEVSIGEKPSGNLSPVWERRLETTIRQHVQTSLKAEGFYNDEIDGVNGPSTRAAIQAYEKSKNLPETGRLSPLLLFILYNQADLQPTLDDLSLFYKRDTIEISGYQPGGNDTLTLQQLKLAYLGDYTGLVDGKSGPGTEESIRRFQARYQLEIDGEIGKATNDKLTSEVITTFQTYLKQEGYMEDNPTGALGPKTKKAIRELKERNGIPVDDDVDIPFMLLAIDSLAGSSLSDIYLAEIKAKQAEEERITTIQAYLIGLNLLTGKADGKVGPATKTAVKRFRQQESLKVSDEINEALLPYIEKAALKKGQAYLADLDYPIKADGIMGPNTRKQLHAFLEKQSLEKSDVITAEILVQLKNEAQKKKALTSSRAPQTTAASQSQTSRTTGDVVVKRTMPTLEKGHQQQGILTSAPNASISTTGTLQILRNQSGQISGCQVGNVSMDTSFCSHYRNGQNCRVAYHKGRVISLHCK